MNIKLNTYANFSVHDLTEQAISENVSEDAIQAWIAKHT